MSDNQNPVVIVSALSTEQTELCVQLAASLDQKYHSESLILDQIQTDTESLAKFLVEVKAYEKPIYDMVRLVFIGALKGKTEKAASRTWNRAYEAASECDEAKSLLPVGGPVSTAPKAVALAEKRKTEKAAATAVIEAAIKSGADPVKMRTEAAKAASVGTVEAVEAASKKLVEADKLEKAIKARADSAASEATIAAREKYTAALQLAREKLPMAAVYAQLTNVLNNALRASEAPAGTSAKKKAAKPATV